MDDSESLAGSFSRPGPAAALAAASVIPETGRCYFFCEGPETAFRFTGRFQGENVGGPRFPYEH